MSKFEFHFRFIANGFFVLLPLALVLVAGCATSSQRSQYSGRSRDPAVAGNLGTVRSETLISWPSRQNHKISRGYQLGPRPHHGLDITGNKGDPVLAAHNGRVIYTGRGYSGYGNLIILDDGNGWSSFYAHLSRFDVKEGQYVERGQVIGGMGRTGRASGTHLHFELRQNKVPVDPAKYLP
jgi:murein DD-endopeptidase MepM/ murein hydrolase activator NlpD